MALDANEGCQSCGILLATFTTLINKRGGRELCKACQCAEKTTSQTPCGQRYCKLCGILIDPIVPNVYDYEYCSACRLMQKDLLQPQQSSTCKCEFCSNDYNMSPPARKFTKMGMEEPTSKKVTEAGSNSMNEKVARGCDPGGPRENLVEEELRNMWEREQLFMKKKVVTQDSFAVKKILKTVKTKDTTKTFYIGGVDISFIKDNNVDACAALIVISFPGLEVVYKRLEMIQLRAPYIPGFLAFREVGSLIQLYKSLLLNAPQYKPDVIFVDGNGRLHPRGFGLACHLGLMLGLPCVGVAKTLIHVDGIEENADHKSKKESLKKEGDTFALTTNGGETLGMALRSTSSASNPVYVSVGHKISLQSAVTLVHHCCKYRIPEPTRFADLYSRQYLIDKKQDPEELIVKDGDSSPS